MQNKKIYVCEFCNIEFCFESKNETVYCPNCGLNFKNKYVRICKNCGKQFILTGYSNSEFCDNIPEGETRTCKVIGPRKIYEKTIKNDKIKYEYRKAYKAMYYKVLAGIWSKQQFQIWADYAKGIFEKTKDKKIDYDSYLVLLRCEANYE
jgi:predicted RNA-binding Zn-ribbon protein involved in translation (DUF1610 family)